MQQNNEILEKNLAALCSTSPGLIDKIREHEIKDVDFIHALSGDIIMTYRGIPLHSIENPVKEAQDIYSYVKEKSFRSFHVIFGLGLGYLFKRASLEVNGNIIVFEHNLDVLKATLQIVDFSEELSRDNVWVINDQIGLRLIFMNHYYSGDFVGVQMLTAYRLMFPDILAETTSALNDLFRDSNINQRTVLVKSKSWSLSALNNLFDVLKAPNMLLMKEKFKDIPAIIVSAGPSLEYALETIKKYQDKILIISVGQALRALHKAGIKPHIVAVIENLNVSQQFDNVDYLQDLTIILQPMTHRAIYDLPVKRFMINYPLSDNIAKWFGRSLDKDISGVPNRGTVSISAYYAAQNAGCSPMILVGQDLAYRDGKCYANNSSYELLKYHIDEKGVIKYNYNEETYQEIGKTFEMSREEFLRRAETQKKDTLTVKGWNGEDLFTSASYSTFINNFVDIGERELPKTDQRLINSSLGGAFIKGLDHMPIEEAIKECNLDHGKDINALIDEVFDEYYVTDKDYLQLYKTIKKAQKDLDTAKKICISSLEMANKINDEIQKNNFNILYVDKMIEKLGKNDKKVINLVKNTEIINPFIQKELFDFSSMYARSAREDEEKDKIENLKLNIIQSIKLYNAVISGTDQINDLLPKVIEKNKDLLKGVEV